MFKYFRIIWFTVCFGVTGLVTCHTVWATNEEILFLAHSTGRNVYREGNVSGWISNYNVTYGTNYSIQLREYPTTPYPWHNYPYDYWNLWINDECNSNDPNIECLGSIISEYDVIIFKHCYPGSDILEDTGSPSVDSSRKSLENYKLQYRALRELMDSYPDTIFIVWTLPPRHRLATNPDNAARAKLFVDWVRNEFLTEDGRPHPNIFIFDFWGIIAEEDQNPDNGVVNCLKYEYERNHTSSDSHPNSLANEIAGPIFAERIVTVIESFQSENQPPTADAGPNRTVIEGSNVMLDGSGSFDLDDGIASYHWSQISGPEVTLSSSEVMQPTFTAPDVGSGSRLILEFGLTVTDYSGLNDSDTCVINVVKKIEGFPIISIINLLLYADNPN